MGDTVGIKADDLCPLLELTCMEASGPELDLLCLLCVLSRSQAKLLRRLGVVALKGGPFIICLIDFTA